MNDARKPTTPIIAPYFSLTRAAGLITLVATLVSFSSASGQTARQIAERTLPSVVLLTTEDASGGPVSLGSGFFVRKDVVATNFHMIERASRARIKIVGHEEKYEVVGAVGTDPERDLALLKVIGVNGQPLSLGDDSQAGPGDTVYAVGNPEGLEGTISQGIVSGIRHLSAETWFQITAPISPGSSGGPVLNLRGEVIAIAVAQVKDGQKYLNFAVPVSYLLPLIAHMRPVAPLARVPAGNAPYEDRGTHALSMLASTLSAGYRVLSPPESCTLTIDDFSGWFSSPLRPRSPRYIIPLDSLDADLIDVLPQDGYPQWRVLVRTRTGDLLIRRAWNGGESLDRDKAFWFATEAQANKAKSDLQRAISLCAHPR